MPKSGPVVPTLDLSAVRAVSNGMLALTRSGAQSVSLSARSTLFSPRSPTISVSTEGIEMSMSVAQISSKSSGGEHKIDLQAATSSGTVSSPRSMGSLDALSARSQQSEDDGDSEVANINSTLT